MTPKGKKVLIISVSLLAIGSVVGYIFWKKAKDKKDEQAKADADKAIPDAQTGGTIGGTIGGSTGGSTNVSTLSNFDALQKNLGLKANKDGNVIVNFNGKLNTATFFKNGRVVISTVGKSGYLKKGTYSNGGLTFAMDGGATFSGSSVYVNLLMALK